MAGGPLFPYSAVPVTTDRVFSTIYTGASSTGMKYEEGLGVQASLGADSIWALAFELPGGTLPTGTLKLRLRARANATSGAAKVNPKWASVAIGADPAAATLSAEGTNTLTWTVADVYLQAKISLVATTAVAGQILVMNLTFETSGFTLAQVSSWDASLIWE